MNKFKDLAESHSLQAKTFIYCTLIWTCIFAIVRKLYKDKILKRKDLNDVRNRIVSIMHGLVSFWLSVYHIFFNDQTFGQPNSNFESFIIIQSLGYFFYDFIACVHYDLVDFQLVLHHALVLLGYGSMFVNKSGGYACVIGLFFAEISNFPMHFRIILRTYNLKYTKLYETLEIAYLILYIVARGLIMPFVCYRVCTDPTVPIIIKLTCFGLVVQSIFFIFEMKNTVKRKGRYIKERKQKDIHYYWFSVNPRVEELEYTKKEQKEKTF